MKKKIYFLIATLAITIMLFILLQGIAYAYNIWSPYDGSAYTTSNRYKLTNLKWSTSSVDWYKAWNPSCATAWEGELRKSGGGSIKGVYEWLDGSWGGNLPSRYREIDSDDVTIGAHNPQNLSPGYSYYGYTYLIPASPQGSFTGYVESEVGRDFCLGGDTLPYNWEKVGSYFTVPGGSTSW